MQLPRLLFHLFFLCLFCKITVAQLPPIDNNSNSYDQLDTDSLLLQQKLHLDNLFLNNQHLEHFTEVTETGQLLIGDLFATGKKYAAIAYKKTEKTLEANIMRQNGLLWDTVLHHESLCYFSEYMPNYKIIELSDFNGDRKPDLRIITDYWEIHTGDMGHIWFFEHENFVHIEGSDSIVNPRYDATTNKIYSYQSDGCGDRNMIFGVYEIKDNKAREIEYVYCDCCSQSENSGRCILTKKNGEINVPAKKVHLHVPIFYQESVKQKLKF